MPIIEFVSHMCLPTQYMSAVATWGNNTSTGFEVETRHGSNIMLSSTSQKHKLLESGRLIYLTMLTIIFEQYKFLVWSAIKTALML